jgi:hypothetical protein
LSEELLCSLWWHDWNDIDVAWLLPKVATRFMALRVKKRRRRKEEEEEEEEELTCIEDSICKV